MATIETRTGQPVAAKREVSDLYYSEPSPEGAGWVVFSAIVLGLVGVWAFFEGLLAIFDSKVYAASATFVFSDLRTAGWMMVLGVLAVLASLALATGSEIARWFGITVAAVNGFGELMFLHANPWWSMAMFAVDILIIYGLAVYGGARLRAL